MDERNNPASHLWSTSDLDTDLEDRLESDSVLRLGQSFEELDLNSRLESPPLASSTPNPMFLFSSSPPTRMRRITRGGSLGQAAGIASIRPRQLDFGPDRPGPEVPVEFQHYLLSRILSSGQAASPLPQVTLLPGGLVTCPVPPPPLSSGLLRSGVALPNEAFTGFRQGRECRFCKSNGETVQVYRSHILRNPTTNKLVCPVLRSHHCEICGATGDDAHTKNYCPFVRSSSSYAPSLHSALKKTRHRGDGSTRE